MIYVYSNITCQKLLSPFFTVTDLHIMKSSHNVLRWAPLVVVYAIYTALKLYPVAFLLYIKGRSHGVSFILCHLQNYSPLSWGHNNITASIKFMHTHTQKKCRAVLSTIWSVINFLRNLCLTSLAPFKYKSLLETTAWEGKQIGTEEGIWLRGMKKRERETDGNRGRGEES